jgi:aspartate racemase
MSIFSNTTQVLGIIGGMGPAASAYFQQLLVQMTDVRTDQEHLPSILLNIPNIPDRTAFILGRSKESPTPVLREAAQTLEALGAHCIAITCVTSHCFYDEVAGAVNIPILHAVWETANYLRERGIRKVGILATTGTIQTGLFQQALDDAGIEWAVPDEKGQADVMHLIYQNVKASRPVELDRFERVSAAMREAGCAVSILGCTELSLIKRDYPVTGCIDVLEVLARAAILRCGKPLDEDYMDLIRE